MVYLVFFLKQKYLQYYKQCQSKVDYSEILMLQNIVQKHMKMTWHEVMNFFVVTEKLEKVMVGLKEYCLYKKIIVFEITEYVFFGLENGGKGRGG